MLGFMKQLNQYYSDVHAKDEEGKEQWQNNSYYSIMSIRSMSMSKYLMGYIVCGILIDWREHRNN